ncbi:MAG: hypothetical protein JST64_14960, partial [Actinobacteria bacterium]|nr:hypothetical protein [Actinomycetota bacterium]
MGPHNPPTAPRRSGELGRSTAGSQHGSDLVLNVAAITEAIARAHPDRDCIVFRDLQLSWSEVADRTRRLALVLRR